MLASKNQGHLETTDCKIFGQTKEEFLNSFYYLLTTPIKQQNILIKVIFFSIPAM